MQVEEVEELNLFSSNRTFMELKCTAKFRQTVSSLRSNRTFMELK